MIGGGGGGFGPAADEEFPRALERYNSIRTTGYDPWIGVFWGTYEITAIRPDGSSTSQTLTNPSLDMMGAAVNSAAVWASATMPVMYQLPQAAAAGAAGGAVSVTVNWIGAGGAVIGGGTLLVAGGVVVGAAAVAVGGYYAWQYYKGREQRQVDYWAKKYGLTYEQLSDYLHQWKQDNGKRPNDNLTKAERIIVAEEAARWFGKR
jgi:uncharacterized protein HemX